MEKLGTEIKEYFIDAETTEKHDGFLCGEGRCGLLRYSDGVKNLPFHLTEKAIKLGLTFDQPTTTQLMAK
jgi:hypothetical protein